MGMRHFWRVTFSVVSHYPLFRTHPCRVASAPSAGDPGSLILVLYELSENTCISSVSHHVLNHVRVTSMTTHWRRYIIMMTMEMTITMTMTVATMTTNTRTTMTTTTTTTMRGPYLEHACILMKCRSMYWIMWEWCRWRRIERHYIRIWRWRLWWR